MRRLLGTLLLLCLVAGCSGDPQAGPAPSSPTTSTTPSVPSGAYDALDRLLDRRARAILAKDRATFLATTAPGPGRAHQLAWYGPLTRLPLAKVSYDVRLVDPHGTAHATRVEADMLVQLGSGFDPAPVPVDHVLTVSHTAGRWKVVEDRADRSQISFAPWLLPHVRFTITDRALVVYDQDSARQADRISRLADEAVATDADHIPYEWPRKVVILAPSSTAPLRYEGFDPVEIQHLGGVAYPIRGPDEQVTGSRIVVAPVMLKQDDQDLLTVLRHEVAHVAIGEHDEQDPVWVVEGIAEYVAHLGDGRLYIATSAVQAAQDGVDQMPPDGLFHSGDWGVNYGIAWWAMQVLALRHGPDAPFDLVDAMHAREPMDFHEESALLDDRYQVTTDELAHQAGELIRTTFGAPG